MADRAPTPGAREALPNSRLAAFAGPLFGLSTPFFFVLFYYFKFATDVLGIAPLVFGLIFGLGRAKNGLLERGGHRQTLNSPRETSVASCETSRQTLFD